MADQVSSKYGSAMLRICVSRFETTLWLAYPRMSAILGLAGHAAAEQHDDLPVAGVQQREEIVGDQAQRPLDTSGMEVSRGF
ncbi:hypothetical protein AB0M48_29890 [Lentzea sp. NPDC051208]|uniref:hypothetical protein n=1 Tax=Lentzea sp. NPDC051208 TaxID=3154642 RepID=UPI003429A24F